MNITLLGAAGGEVTGSASYVEGPLASVLVDAGLFQGGAGTDALNRFPPRVRRRLDAVLLTHGHLDHCGRLPLLVKSGYRGPVYATPATVKIAALMLRDAARLQVADVERKNRRRMRAGARPLEPLYTPADVERLLELLQPVDYHRPIPVAPGMQALWAESGHMLGSAGIQLIVDDRGTSRRVVFSGDLGPRSAPILKEFEPFHQADLAIMESTYGDRDHRPYAETVDEFVHIVQQAVEDRGKILIPTFAVGRAQLLTTLLAWMVRHGKIPPIPLFLDSPMAIEATKIYAQHRELFDDEMLRFITQRPLSEDLKALKLCSTPQESQAINSLPGPCLIMAGAGMCNAGRILHHLKHNLWKPGTHVVIVGYQSHGSLGRRLVEGDKLVTIHGQKVAVKARIHTLGGFSAHAGQSDLLAWLAPLAPAAPRLVLNHGEDRARQVLAGEIHRRFGIVPLLPALGETIEL